MTDAICVLAHHRDPDRPRPAADGILVCAGHRTALGRTLAELPGMHARLAAAHTASTGGKSEIRTGGHAGLSLVDGVADARSGIYFALAGWAKLMAEERGWHLPADELGAIGRFLLGRDGANLDWWAAHPAVDEVWAELDPLHRQAFALLHPTGRRRFAAGACIEVTSCSVATRLEERCPGRMLATITDSADILPSGLFCDECGVEIPASGWVTYGRRVQKAMGVAS